MKLTLKRAINILLMVLATMLTLAAVGESAAQISNVPDHAICPNALNSERSDWDKNPDHSIYVAEATRRALSIIDCRKLLGWTESSTQQHVPQQPQASQKQAAYEEFWNKTL